MFGNRIIQRTWLTEKIIFNVTNLVLWSVITFQEICGFKRRITADLPVIVVVL